MTDQTIINAQSDKKGSFRKPAKTYMLMCLQKMALD